MTLKECYQILDLNQSASLEEVKRAYRQRAFALHPDLNPGIADASRQFQRLNEAYVILSKLIAVREERDKKKSGQAQRERAQETPRSEEGSSSTASGAEATGTAHQKARENTAAHDSASASHEQPSAASESAASASATSASATAAPSDPPPASGSASHEQPREAPHQSNPYAEQQEVLQDILSDPFARRVFEDIYSEIRKKAPPPSPTPPSLKRKPKTTPSRLSTLLNWGQRRINLDFSKGLGGALKGWLRNQIDEEQLFELPAHRLIPGARIRLQIRHGFSDEVTTLDVTLPPDFTSEKPIRLKGMGKKLGHWQGDLYLRFSAKQ